MDVSLVVRYMRDFSHESINHSLGYVEGCIPLGYVEDHLLDV